MRHRVFEAALPEWVDPADLVAGLFGDESDAVWLDSGPDAVDGMSYLGLGTRTLRASVPDHTVTIDGEVREADLLGVLREELVDPGRPGTGFRLGWVGWLGYELRAQTMGVASTHHSRYPDASMLFVDRAVAFDHATRTARVMGLDAASVGELRERVLRFSVGRRVGRPAQPVDGEVRWSDTDAEYLREIRQCQGAIDAGDAYQLCLTTEARVPATPDPLDAYLALRRISPSHHGAFFRAGDVSLLSSSPELFLSVSPEGTIESRPIKGTRRRGATAEEDAALVAELLASDKERAENLMIVDLMRNDIGRVSRVGSVTVPRLLAVETYAHVHQLVSTVRGILAPGLVGVDAVAACFPAGSMTGAPKHSAVAILDRLEHRARGVYSGAFGYFGLDGRIELSMVIRSILLDAEGATVGTGGGITALSVPADELAEAKLKSAASLAVLGVAPSA